jgi:hypothetical protein
MADKRAGRLARQDTCLRLGEFICEQNPFPGGTALKADDLCAALEDSLKNDPLGADPARDAVRCFGPGARRNQESPFSRLAETYEEFMQGLFWPVDGRMHRISKVVRVKYLYGLPGGGQREGYLLIGYEGGGGL